VSGAAGASDAAIDLRLSSPGIAVRRTASLPLAIAARRTASLSLAIAARRTASLSLGIAVRRTASLPLAYDRAIQ